MNLYLINLSIRLIKFDEVSLNEIASNVLGTFIFVDLMPTYDKNVYERLHSKAKEFNRNICTENDETARKEKWQNWARQEKQLFLDTNEMDNISFIDRVNPKSS